MFPANTYHVARSVRVFSFSVEMGGSVLLWMHAAPCLLHFRVMLMFKGLVGQSQDVGLWMSGSVELRIMSSLIY